MLGNPLLANIGLPMVAIYLPLAWFALAPIILIESGFGARRFNLKFRRSLLAQTVANCLSTLIGIPVAWLVLVLIQAKTVPGGTGPAWLNPEPNWWTVTGAFLALTIVFYFMSVVSEGLIVQCFFRDLPRQTLRRWMFQANGISYAFLVAVFFAGSLAPKVTTPLLAVMQPVNEAIVDTAFWLIRAREPSKESPFIDAVDAGDLKKIKKMIADGVNVNQENRFGYPALHISARRGDRELTKLLLDAGADVNAYSSALHDTALAAAAQFGNTETIRLLIAAHADLEARDNSGWTPLFTAAMRGDTEIVDLFLSAGANINARSGTGWTALKEAEYRKQVNIIQRLKAAGAIDFPDGSR